MAAAAVPLMIMRSVDGYRRRHRYRRRCRGRRGRRRRPFGSCDLKLRTS